MPKLILSDTVARQKDVMTVVDIGTQPKTVKSNESTEVAKVFPKDLYLYQKSVIKYYEHVK